MSWEGVQVARRKWSDLWRPPIWPPPSIWLKHFAITGIAALGLGLSGAVWPGSLLPTVPRTALWLITSLLTALQWIAAGTLLRPAFNAFRLPPIALHAIVPLVLAPVCAAEYVLASKAFGLLREMRFDHAALLFGWIFLRNAYLVAFPVLLVARWAARHSPERAKSIAPPPAPAVAEAPAPITACADQRLLGLLPAAIRAPIVALKAEDHYVRVFTERGNTLLLMRFADALTHVAQLRGLRIHRSYWVNEAAILKRARNGRRSELHLTGGLIVPVSRAHEDEVAARVCSTGVR
ncbi:MAG: LytTR family DNA-binding domain-containing protein [Alphaproteobacteria bacterium]